MSRSDYAYVQVFVGSSFYPIDKIQGGPNTN